MYIHLGNELQRKPTKTLGGLKDDQTPLFTQRVGADRAPCKCVALRGALAARARCVCRRMVFAQFAQFELLGEMVADEWQRLGSGLLPFEGQQNRTQALQLLCNDKIRARGMRMDAGGWVRGCWHLKANRTAPSRCNYCAMMIYGREGCGWMQAAGCGAVAI